MRIFLLALACIVIGMVVGVHMAAEGKLPGCDPKPVVSTGK
jgi:hypothetical protein